MNLRDFARSIIREHSLAIVNLRREIRGLLPEGHAAAVGALRAQRRNRATAGDYLRLRALDRELRAAAAVTGPQRSALRNKIHNEHAWYVRSALALLAHLRGRGPVPSANEMWAMTHLAKKSGASPEIVSGLADIKAGKPVAPSVSAAA